MFSAPGPLELIVILTIALIFLGPKRLPDAARSVGKGMREFRESLSGFDPREEDDPYDANELETDDPDDEDPRGRRRSRRTPRPFRTARRNPRPSSDS